MTKLTRAKISALFAFLLVLASALNAFAAVDRAVPDWRQPPSDAEVYQRNQKVLRDQYGIDLRDLKELRNSFDRNPILMARPSSRGGRGGGIFTGSGGGGRACFDAPPVPALIDELGRLKSGASTFIRTLEVADFVELRALGWTPLSPEPNDTSMTFIDRLLTDFVKPAHPVLEKKLRIAISAVHPMHWFHRGSQRRIDDAGFQVGPYPECEYVQMITRFDRSRTSEVPAVIVDADFSLLQRLHELYPPSVAVLNEAMLIMHEALYLIAFDQGWWTSDGIRRLNAKLFSKELYYEPAAPNKVKGKKKAVSVRRSPEKVFSILRESFPIRMDLLDQIFSFTQTESPNAQMNGTARDFYNTNTALMDYLSNWVRRNVSQKLFSVWDITIFPSEYEALANDMQSRSDLENFLFQGRVTFLILRKQYGYKVEDFWERPQMTRDLLLDYCHSMEKDLVHAKLSKELKGTMYSHPGVRGTPPTAIIERALRFCRSEGVQPMTPDEFRAWNRRMSELF